MPTPQLHNLLTQCAAMHEHLCPKQVLGVRMGMHAAEVLGIALPQHDKRLLTIVETDGCFADGIAVATGCWLGHRTLRCVDHGKVAATFVDTLTSESVRMHPSPTARERALHDAPMAEDRWHAYLEGYQVMPVHELLVAERVHLSTPVVDVISTPDRRAICEACHEEIINDRQIVTLGRVLCRSCAGEPYVTPCTPTSNGVSGGR